MIERKIIKPARKSSKWLKLWCDDSDNCIGRESVAVYEGMRGMAGYEEHFKPPRQPTEEHSLDGYLNSLDGNLDSQVGNLRERSIPTPR